MNNKKIISIAKRVIDLEVKALQVLKRSIDKSFIEVVTKISKCQSKVILCGVGKSGLIASKIAATLSSVGTPSFCISAGDSSHGDLGSISKKDILILISNSGKTSELKNIIQYANRNKILLIGIVSKKDSLLYNASDIKILIPQVIESEGIIPTSSTAAQLAIGDALAIAAMKYKKFSKLDFKKIHPAGNLGAQLKTVEDIMLTGNNIPFVKENMKMKEAIKILSNKKLGVLIVKNNRQRTTGIITDGQIRRFSQGNPNIHSTKVNKVMTKNPIGIEKNALAAKALSIMNENKITSLHVYEKKNPYKTIGIVHIHNILQFNIT